MLLLCVSFLDVEYLTTLKIYGEAHKHSKLTFMLSCFCGFLFPWANSRHFGLNACSVSDSNEWMMEVVQLRVFQPKRVFRVTLPLCGIDPVDGWRKEGNAFTTNSGKTNGPVTLT